MEKKILSEKRIELLKIIDKYGILTRKQIHEHVNIAEINLFKGIKLNYFHQINLEKNL